MISIFGISSILILVLLNFTQGSGNLKAVLHVGPYKTASTWFQNMIYRFFVDKLTAENYYPILLTEMERKILQNAKLADCLTQHISGCNYIISSYHAQIKDHYELNHNIYISSEVFSSVKLDIPRLLHLLEGFDVRVVMVYRDYLHQFESQYNQIYKLHLTNLPFSAYVQKCLHVYTVQCRHHYLSATNTAKHFLKYVNISQIQIFDYNGIIAANRDNADIMMRYVFPDLSPNFFFNLTKDIEEIILVRAKYLQNAQISLTPMDLFNIAQQKNENKTKNPHLCVNKFSDYSKSLGSSLPLDCVTDQDYQKLVNLSLKYEHILRNKFAKNVIYGNHSANLEKIHKKLSLDQVCNIVGKKLNESELQNIDEIYSSCL